MHTSRNLAQALEAEPQKNSGNRMYHSLFRFRNNGPLLGLFEGVVATPK